MARLAPFLKQQFIDGNGAPLAFGFVYTYVAGSAVPQSTYTDQSGLTANQNPVELDADGRADIWLADAAYKFIVCDADDNPIYTVDNVEGEGGGEAVVIPWTTHAITAGQSATNLAAITMNTLLYSSRVWEYEIIRGTTIYANGRVAIQNVNGTPRAVETPAMSEEAHGVTFSASAIVSNSTNLMAAVSAGSNGTIKLTPVALVPV